MEKDMLKPFTENDLRRKDVNPENVAKAIAAGKRISYEDALKIVREAIAEIRANEVPVEAEPWTEMNDLLNNVAKR